MAKVKLIFTSHHDAWTSYDELVIEVDGKIVAEGSYGGEPEDNSRYRDYFWVEHAIRKVAEKLGAEVMIENN